MDGSNIEVSQTSNNSCINTCTVLKPFDFFIYFGILFDLSDTLSMNITQLY